MHGIIIALFFTAPLTLPDGRGTPLAVLSRLHVECGTSKWQALSFLWCAVIFPWLFLTFTRYCFLTVTQSNPWMYQEAIQPWIVKLLAYPSSHIGILLWDLKRPSAANARYNHFIASYIYPILRALVGCSGRATNYTHFTTPFVDVCDTCTFRYSSKWEYYKLWLSIIHKYAKVLEIRTGISKQGRLLRSSLTSTVVHAAFRNVWQFSGSAWIE